MTRTRSTAAMIALVAGTTALVGAAAAAVVGAMVVRFARTLVTPPVAKEQTVRILSVDLAAAEVVLAATDETTRNGRYGLWFSHDSGYARIGDVLEQDGERVRRRLEGVAFGRLERAERGRTTAWYYLGPWDLGLAYEDVVVDTELGPAPAWVVAAEDGSSDRWMIQVHGWGGRRQEGLRAVPIARANGWTSLLVSYRNDGEAPDSADRRLGLGSTEWRDVLAAVRFAKSRGAERIVLMGWSMGGATVLQTVLRSDEVRELLEGVVLDSPAIDWVDILRFQGRTMGLPAGLGNLVANALGDPVGAGLAGLAQPIDVSELDAAARAEEFDVPMLLLHSEDDGFVPIDGSRRLAAARPDLIEFEVFEGARHTRLWNHEPVRWTSLIDGWLTRREREE